MLLRAVPCLPPLPLVVGLLLVPDVLPGQRQRVEDGGVRGQRPLRVAPVVPVVVERRCGYVDRRVGDQRVPERPGLAPQLVLEVLEVRVDGGTGGLPGVGGVGARARADVGVLLPDRLVDRRLTRLGAGAPLVGVVGGGDRRVVGVVGVPPAPVEVGQVGVEGGAVAVLQRLDGVGDVVEVARHRVLHDPAEPGHLALDRDRGVTRPLVADLTGRPTHGGALGGQVVAELPEPLPGVLEAVRVDVERVVVVAHQYIPRLRGGAAVEVPDRSNCQE
ncbi:hypothetical protein [Nocardioides sp. TF02-7]|uniref:hypothetical protein n=1 Tax=Nocardioides sp. TF02-7 TaxID=2917724 RepID=UPI001F053F2A|nr:hypothetical protein [Nocardioides sp. TF02-7]UMG93310.1 hypothetical protein MF408_03245 [Nocardioides sp. TF02-7]